MCPFYVNNTIYTTTYKSWRNGISAFMVKNEYYFVASKFLWLKMKLFFNLLHLRFAFANLRFLTFTS